MPTGNRIALVGCGIWGIVVLRELLSLDSDVIVIDSDRTARDNAAKVGAQAVIATVDELDDVDGAVVATPAVTHASIVEALLPRNVPLLVEKPFTTDIPSAERLARIGNGRLFVGHTWRYHPGMQLLGEIARNGELGPVVGLKSVRANWTSPRKDVDSVWNLAPHDVTLAIEILGHIPEPRAAIAEMHDGRAVGLSAILGGAPWLVFDVSNRSPEKRREVRLQCRDGVATIADPDSGALTIARGNSSSPAPRIEQRTYSPESALMRELTAFLAFVKGGPPPKSPAAEGVDVVKTIVRLRELAGL